jgi:hypothetical protein
VTACAPEATTGLDAHDADEAPSAPAARPWLSEEGAARGLRFEHVSGHREHHLMPETMGGGAALFDMDGDGDLDAYLVQSGSLYDDSGTQPTNALFANLGDGRFEDVTPQSGTGDSGYGMGVACGDVDGDGDIDIYVTNYGPNVLLLNDGDGHFADATKTAGVGDPSWSTSAAFFDLENDGDLDLYVCNYLDWSLANELPCRNTMGLPDFCSPLNYHSPAADTVYVNDGTGKFTNLSLKSGVAEHLGTGLGVVCADFDGDNRIEIFVANDGMPNFLWVPTPSRWEETAQSRGCALDGDGAAKAGMGVEVEDIDGDGDPDLLVCNLRLQSDSFYRNDGALFSDRSAASGLGAVSRPFTRFGLGWVDFDNDGLQDIYEANGRVMREAHTFSEDPYAEPNLLLRGLPSVRFEVVSGGEEGAAPQAFNSRAAAFGDIDNDGGVDVLVVNIDGPAQLFRNVVAERGSWVSFTLLDPSGSALHARVSVDVDSRKEFRFARAAASYQASNDPRVHFGLGLEALVHNVTVTWPDGAVEFFGDRESNQNHVLTRGTGESESPQESEQ